MEAVGDPDAERRDFPQDGGEGQLYARLERLESRVSQLEKSRNRVNGTGYPDPASQIGDKIATGPWWRTLWLGLADFGMDMGLLPRIFTDPRYRLPWTVRIGVPILGIAFFFSDYLMPLGLASLPVIGKVFDLLIAGLFFWLIWREVRRYRRVSLDLPESWKTER